MPRPSVSRRAALWLPPLVYVWIVFHLSSESDPLPALTTHVWDKRSGPVAKGHSFARGIRNPDVLGNSCRSAESIRLNRECFVEQSMLAIQSVAL